MNHAGVTVSCLLGLLLLATAPLRAEESEPRADDRQYLVPAMEGATLHITEGRRRFARHFAVSPALGKLGEDDLFAMRVAYNPRHWLGWEIALGHNPASSLHALQHTFNALLRYPLPGRLQPYANLGFGMMTVYPGQAVKADPVTKNTLAYGGGLELYVRDDVALRGELRGATILGQDPGQDNTVAYTYREYTLGVVFYRDLGE
jgi:hypothetical protein